MGEQIQEPEQLTNQQLTPQPHSFLSKLNWKYIGVGFAVALVIGVGAFWLGRQSLIATIDKVPKNIPQGSQITLNPTQQQLVNNKNRLKNNSQAVELTETFTHDGFIFKYPSSWVLEYDIDSANLVTTRKTTSESAPDYYAGMAWINISQSNESIETVINRIAGGVDKREQITLDGNPAVRLSGMQGVAGSVFFITIVTERNGETYVLSLSTQDDEIKESVTAEFDKMLLTFKFTD